MQPFRLAIFLLVSAAALSGFLAFEPSPLAQPLAYHNFADQRSVARLPHALNVLSNLPFLIVGLLGMAFLASARSRRPGVFLQTYERAPYWMYFAGLALTGLGSAYYHANPNNETLVWDRIALTVAFMGLFTAVLAERIDVRLAAWLLAPLVAAGAGSVLYWHFSEQAGVGDLRPYFIVQFYPILAISLLLLLYPARYTRTGDLVGALAWYAVAKVLELLDGKIYAQGQIVSGHTLKHLIAGISAYLILHMLQRRSPCRQENGGALA